MQDKLEDPKEERPGGWPRACWGFDYNFTSYEYISIKLDCLFFFNKYVSCPEDPQEERLHGAVADRDRPSGGRIYIYIYIYIYIVVYCSSISNE